MDERRVGPRRVVERATADEVAMARAVLDGRAATGPAGQPASEPGQQLVDVLEDARTRLDTLMAMLGAADERVAS